MPIHLFLAAVTIGVSAIATNANDNWPQFRGPGGQGIGSGHPPTEWDISMGNNVAWKTPIPGLGQSAPIVWEDRVFLTTAVNTDSEQTKTRLSPTAALFIRGT